MVGNPGGCGAASVALCYRHIGLWSQFSSFSTHDGIDDGTHDGTHDGTDDGIDGAVDGGTDDGTDA